MPVRPAFENWRPQSRLGSTFSNPGPSGYWGGSGSIFTSPTSGPAPFFPSPALGIPSRYGNTAGTGTNPTDTGFTSLVQERFPGSGYNDALGKLSADLSKAGSSLPNFSETLSAVTGANRDVGGAFDRYQGALNIDDYTNTQRGFNPAFSGLTGGYADTARGIGTRYGQSVQDYTGAGGDVLDANLENARQFRDTEIPNSINDALATVGKNLKLYDFSNPGGYNSAIPAIGGREAVRATLPFRLEANRNYGNALMARLPFLGDVASRNANLAGFDLGNETNIYGQQQGDVIRRQQTEDKIQNLKLQTAGLSLEAAIRKAPTLAAGAYELSRIFNLPVEQIMRQAQAMGVILGLQGQANYTGLEQNGGANVVEPQYFPNRGLPSRYSPQAQTQTGTRAGAQQGAAQGVVPNREPSWVAALSPEQKAAYYARQYQQPTHSTPFDPNATSGGWGFVNGQYIGADANEWNQPWPVGT